MPITLKTRLKLARGCAGALALAALAACHKQKPADRADGAPGAAPTHATLKPVLPGQETPAPAPPATAEATQSPMVLHDYSTMQVSNKNLVPDAAFRNIKTQWTVIAYPRTAKYKLEREKVDLPNGQSAFALKLTTDQSVEICMQHPAEVDFAGKYEFSLWVKQSPSPKGQRFFGFYAYDRSGKQIGAYDAAGKLTPTNQHFIAVNHQDSMWRKLTGMLLPSDAIAADFPKPQLEGQGQSFRISSQTKAVNMFFLNFYNQGHATTTWIALPTIAEYK